MRIMPLSIGKIHFIGIGGIGMSGIAEVLHNLGYRIQGSDLIESSNIERLRKIGIPIYIGHSEQNINGADVIVVSSAVKQNNLEILLARKKFLPVVQRAEMLAELMRLKRSIAVGGTHGKTTTTSLIAQLLEVAELDPTVINGGIINAWGTNARLGESDWLVAEADESDGTFLKLPAVIAVVTNIDPEHLDFYGSFDSLRKAFRNFVRNIPFYGFAALCIDHPEVQALIPTVSDRRVVTYGFSPQANIRGLNLRYVSGGSQFDVTIKNRTSKKSVEIDNLYLPMVGEHNVQNALGTIAVALEMGISKSVIRSGLSQFEGVKRRFTSVGIVDDISIIDDYGHHPVEISAALSAARAVTKKRVIAVVQPHRFSRLQELFNDFCTCFNDADEVIISNVFAAGEEKIKGFDRDSLIKGLRSRGHSSVHALDNPEDLIQIISPIAEPGDLIIFLGAGDITAWAQALPDQLRAERNHKKFEYGAQK